MTTRDKKQEPLTVKEFLHHIKHVLKEMGQAEVRGEISEAKVVNGNAYIVLKDTEENAIINCFMGRWRLEKHSHLLEEGMEVVIRGTPDIYEPYGKFTVMIDAMAPVGEGTLKRAFEALKKKLKEKGYFDEERKRPIPEYIKHIGLITSEKGEAINDFRRNLGEYGFTIHMIDVRVEGEFAEDAIVAALHEMNKQKEINVIALIRGGGGLENLKAFNSERIAEAILTSRIPVITGIGHEGDESIADYTADYRCSTPTGAAVLLRTARESLLSKIQRASDDLVTAFERSVQQRKMRIVHASDQMTQSLGRVFEKFHHLEMELTRAFEQKLKMTLTTLHALASTLNTLNPAEIMKRGYSLTYSAEGRLVKEAGKLKIGEIFYAKLYKGKIKGEVKGIRG
jgi:exodeoxyribonuclease VII large subunit